MGCKVSYVPLGELAEFESGGTPSKKIESYWGGSIPWISAKTLVGDTVYESDLTISKEGLESGSKLASKGSLLLLTRGSGLFKRIPLAIAGIQVAYNQDIKCISANAKGISNRYLFYALKALEPAISAMLETTGIGAGKLATDRLKALPIPVLAEDARAKVTSFADCIYGKISLNAKLNGYLAELAQTLYNDWFRDFGHWDGRMPSHWESGVLGDYVTVKRGGSPRPIQEYLSNEGLRWLKIADVSGINGPYILEIKEHIKKEGLRRTVYLEPGSLVLSNSATPGIPKILSIGTCIHDGWLYFPQSEFTNEWLYCYFLNVRQELVRMANGSVFQNLKTDIVKNFEVIRPDDETLASFQKAIAPLFGLMETRQQESKQLAELRDALLPKLMSGEIDVTKVDLTLLNSHLSKCSSGSCCILPVMAALPATK